MPRRHHSTRRPGRGRPCPRASSEPARPNASELLRFRGQVENATSPKRSVTPPSRWRTKFPHGLPTALAWSRVNQLLNRWAGLASSVGRASGCGLNFRWESFDTESRMGDTTDSDDMLPPMPECASSAQKDSESAAISQESVPSSASMLQWSGRFFHSSRRQGRRRRWNSSFTQAQRRPQLVTPPGSGSPASHIAFGKA